MLQVSLVIVMAMGSMSTGTVERGNDSLNERLSAYLAERQDELGQIPEERRKQLDEFADYLKRCIQAGRTPKVLFACTHNSRRSQICQVMLLAAVNYCQATSLESYSGGTEVTACNPRTVALFKRIGFEVQQLDAKSANPHYEVRMGRGIPSLVCFSKLLNDPENPQQQFCVVMACSQADEACPTVLGAESRFSINYQDPKAADGTEQEEAAYDERCRQIAREMLYVARQLPRRP